MLTPTIGGPYGFPYSVPSGGPRASIALTQTCVTAIKDPGLLRLGLKPKPALQFRVEET